MLLMVLEWVRVGAGAEKVEILIHLDSAKALIDNITCTAGTDIRSQVKQSLFKG